MLAIKQNKLTNPTLGVKNYSKKYIFLKLNSTQSHLHFKKCYSHKILFEIRSHVSSPTLGAT